MSPVEDHLAAARVVEGARIGRVDIGGDGDPFRISALHEEQDHGAMPFSGHACKILHVAGAPRSHAVGKLCQAGGAGQGDGLDLDVVGNLSGASVPVALDYAVRSGKGKRGDIILFVAFGGGFTWGATLMEWNDDQ